MTDATIDPANRDVVGVPQPKCAARENIDLSGIIELLRPIQKSFSTLRPVFDETRIPSDERIDPKFLSRTFAPFDTLFVVNPTVEKIERRTEENKNQLSLQNVAQLLEDVVHTIETDARYSPQISTNLTLDEQDVFNRISRRSYLSVFSDHPIFGDTKELIGKLVQIFPKLALPAPTAATKKRPVFSTILPAWLDEPTPEMATVQITALHNWKAVREAAERFADVIEEYKDLERDKQLDFPGVQLRHGEDPVSPQVLRDFLNKWIDLLYEGSATAVTKLNLPTKRVYFSSAERSIGESNSDLVSKLDLDPISFLGDIFELIEHYSEKVAKPAYVAKEEAEERGGSDSETPTQITQALDTNSEDFSLLEKFSAAGVSYTNETNRLKNILLLQFFQGHGLYGAARDLQQLQENLSPEQRLEFHKIEYEFALQLEYVLRTLSVSEVEDLQNAHGRMKVLRKLYQRLSGRAQFLEFVRGYVKHEAEIAAQDIVDPEERKQKVAQYLERVSLNAENIDDLLRQSARFGELKGAFQETIIELSPTLDLHNLSHGDFAKIFAQLGFSPAEETTVFSTLDSLVINRFTPNRIRSFSSDQIEAVFGFPLPAKLLQYTQTNSQGLQQFLSLCAEYVHLRRSYFAELYELDSISQNQDGAEGEQTGFSDEELLKTQQIRELLAKYPRGGTQILLLARSGNHERIQSYVENGVEDANEIEKEYQRLQEVYLERQINFFKSLGAAERAAFIQRLGFANEVDFQNYITQELQESSAYEDEGDVLITYDVPTGQSPRQIRYSDGSGLARSPLNQNLQLQKNPKRKFQAGAADIAASLALKAASTAPGVGGFFAALDAFIPQQYKKYVVGGIAAAAAAFAFFIANLLTKMFSSIYAAVGGIIGAGLGAFAGSLIPGLGTWVGGTLGGIAGGWLGAHIGEALAPSATTGSAIGAATPAATRQTGAVLSGLQKTSFLSRLFGPSMAAPIGMFIVGAGATLAKSTTLSAFLPPPPGESSISQYVDIQKTADPEDNLSAPQDIKYTITIQPKPGYTIDVTDLTDTFSFAGNSAKRQDQKTDPSPLPTSPINLDALKQKNNGGTELNPSTKISFDAYSIHYGNEYHDASVTNTVILKFKIANQSGSEQTAQFAKSICFGSCPQASGCFEFGDANQQIDACGEVATTQEWSETEKSLINQAYFRRAGKNATYSNLLCKAGPITLYRVAGSSFGGCAPSKSGKMIVIYSLGLGSVDNAEYTLVHETGHLIDYRNSGLRERFKSEAPWSGSYFTYPYIGNEYEAFAEGTVDTVIHNTHLFCSESPDGIRDCSRRVLYQFPTLHPAEHNWFVQNIFGGNDPSPLQQQSQ